MSCLFSHHNRKIHGSFHEKSFPYITLRSFHEKSFPYITLQKGPKVRLNISNLCPHSRTVNILLFQETLLTILILITMLTSTSPCRS